MDLKSQFLKYRKEYILNFFKALNDEQKKAVFCLNGPVLILAGAGSGKTTVIVNRIFNMIMFGDAYNSEEVFGRIGQQEIDSIKYAVENNCSISENISHLISVNSVKPYNILAITFTNKAAKELNDRLVAKLNLDDCVVDAFTFHSFCMKVLRRNANFIGFNSNFTIYDTDDSKRVLRDIYKNLNIDEKLLPFKYVMNNISRFKDNLLTPKEASKVLNSDYKSNMIIQIYNNYQNILTEANAMDFDDLIFNCINLFLKNDDVLQRYQNKYKYIMVDEYQDTNFAQYKLVEMLSQVHNNVCVVGDDDQSIYKFRGATIENILNFEKTFKNTNIIKLEENYRSTQNILSCANDVIKNNNSRKPKRIWTKNPVGDKIIVNTSNNEYDEAQYICDKIEFLKSKGYLFSDIAVLYRMNSHSNLIEQCFAKRAIPYRIFGGLRFFDRKEIKDLISYLCVINNHSDNVRLKRIINEPKRGIGDTTVYKISDIANNLGISFFDVLKNVEEYPSLSRSKNQILQFVELIEYFSDNPDNLSIYDMTNVLLEKSLYFDYLNQLGQEGISKIENIQEFLANILRFEQENENATLNDFLEEISLITSLDNYNQDDDFITMMTLHSAKGLEFNNVFIIAFENGIFPSNQSEEENLLEEERRLCYVGITRAKQNLFITNAISRTFFGQTLRNKPSVFLSEMNQEYLDYNRPVSINIDKKSSVSISNFNKKSKTIIQSYEVGDCILHKVFGEGKILAVNKMANDYLLTIDFENRGLKKIMANFANLKKL